MARTNRETSVTGRDGYIMNQALLYAVAYIQSLPPERQEFSNMLDMCSLALAHSSVFTIGQIVGVEAHTKRTINLWPLGDEDYTPDELRHKAELTAAISRMRKSQLAFDVQRGVADSADPEVIEMVEALKAGKAIQIWNAA